LFTRLKDERGVAMVTAIAASFVILLLSVTAYQLAVHNTEQSALDRRRVQAIAASEAGVHYYLSQFQSGGPETFPCSVTETMPGQPNVAFQAGATYYDAAGTVMACPISSGQLPDGALIRSTGTVGTPARDRTMEAYVKLIPVGGGALGDDAVFSDGDLELNSNVQLFQGSIPADMYTNGSALLNSNTVVNGSLTAQGSVTLDSNAEVKQDLVARQYVHLKSTSIVRGDVTSATEFVTLDSNAHVYGDARAGTSITVLGSALIDGIRTPNSPSTPPGAKTFPAFTYVPADWQNEGYTVTSFSSCALAKTFIGLIVTGDHVVRINADCELKWDGNTVVNVRGNLAIIHNGSVTFDSNSGFQNVGAPHNLYFFLGLGGTSTCKFEMLSNSQIGSDLLTLIHTPCEVHMNSNAFLVRGQIFAGGEVNFDSNGSIYGSSVSVPGVPSGSFSEDIVYFREVVT
jgi:cytoskeletal protein CcmA (bactofilin family)